MRLNLDFYKDDTKESISESEQKIIDYINKYESELYGKIFEEDNTIETMLALSNIRHNILSWYEINAESSCLEIRSKFWRNYRRIMR